MKIVLDAVALRRGRRRDAPSQSSCRLNFREALIMNMAELTQLAGSCTAAAAVQLRRSRFNFVNPIWKSATIREI